MGCTQGKESSKVATDGSSGANSAKPGSSGRPTPPNISIPAKDIKVKYMDRSPGGSGLIQPASPLPAHLTASLERMDSTASISSTGSRECDIVDMVAKKRAIARNRRVDVFAAAPEDTGDTERIVIAKSNEVRALLQEALTPHFLFSSLEQSHLDEILDAFGPVSAGTGEVIIEEGSDGNHFFVIESGSVNVSVEGTILTTLGPKSHFGELALLYNCPRTASVTATEPCVLWSVGSTTFKRIVCSNAAKEIAELTHFLRRVDVLKDLTSEQLLQLAEALHVEEYAEGENIVIQGDPGLMFYLIKSGEVQVSQEAEDGEKWDLGHLGPGDYFGERALLTVEPRTATVTATVACRCLVLERTDFVDMLGPLQDLMEARHGERLRSPASPYTGVRKGRFTHFAPDDGLRQDVTKDDLEIVAALGQGAFGLVSLVRHIPTGRAFALKAMNKMKIVEAKQKAGVCNERRILSQISHPLVLNLVATFQDRDRLYMLLEFLQGGDLFSLVLREGGLFSNNDAKFYIASVVSVFEMLHRKNILYRDLKPENLVLNSRGYCKMVDFGFAKETTERTYTFCGTPEYLAPEIIANKGHHKGVDCWALGVLAFELVSGFSPFSTASGDQMEIYKRIMKVQFEFPRHVTNQDLQDLIRRCFIKNPAKRLGCLKNGMLDIKRHRWLQGFDWAALHSMTLPPPFVPSVSDPFDAQCFESFSTSSKHDKPYTLEDQEWCAEF